MEKEFGDNANYAKGHGAEFRQWKKEYHPDEYLSSSHELTICCRWKE
jgi:hypothetical protein